MDTTRMDMTSGRRSLVVAAVLAVLVLTVFALQAKAADRPSSCGHPDASWSSGNEPASWSSGNEGSGGSGSENRARPQTDCTQSQAKRQRTVRPAAHAKGLTSS